MADDLRTVLRRATAAVHEQLDRCIAKLELDRADQYRMFLLAHARVVLPLEQWLETTGMSDELPDWPSRRRRALLMDDLHRLSAVPPPACTMSFDNARATRIGMLYALEGSRLGGFILARRVAANPSLPRSFLMHGYQDDVWGGFVNWLNERELELREIETAACSALQVFKLYLQAFGALSVTSDRADGR